MADEAVRAPALGGVTERLDAQDDAHRADDDDVPITRSEGAKQVPMVLWGGYGTQIYYAYAKSIFHKNSYYGHTVIQTSFRLSK